MTVTFKDVAKLAGVSTQTVSRVTNGSENVAEKTRKKVNQAIKQLGYVPNKGAQMLSRAKSKNIGLVTLDMALHGAALIANGVRHMAHDLDCGTAISVVSEPTLANVQEAIRELIAQQVEGVVLNVPLTSENALKVEEQFQSLKLVFIDVPETAPVHFVHGAHAEGAEQAAAHLINRGRGSFMLITGPENSSASQVRLESWLKIIKQEERQIAWRYTGDWQAQSGYLAIREAFAQNKQFDAVLVASDQMALGALRALYELNIRVPEQVAVVGFDGIEDSAYFTPPLTTIKQDFKEIGRQAVIQAMKLIELGNQPNIELHQHHVPVDLIERRSSEEKEISNYNKHDIQQLLRQIESMLPG
ncbi:LacI family DNA-binding transcriptional regulator [Vibrio maerlii]|uniref:LacI family DNA-binding transcriptional regulator n=1 Tax=Vibrio maerlii TaxID=2231648 RepID=UPI000E3BC990|nr:LacI family DNA-binding transcriptional regulator [Vibrio maerlii]